MRIVFLSLLMAAGAFAGPAEDLAFFESQVRPLLLEHCIECHGPKKQSASLRLDSRDAIIKGGESGTAIDLKMPNDSRLIKAIRHVDGLKMPPNKKLPASSVAVFEEWLKRGAPWPASPATPPAAVDWKKHWSFQPIRPVDKSASIDSLIRARLKERGLSPSAPADRRTLIRRLSFDLTGLPPSPEEVESFVADQSPGAVESLVDRLLASSAYGEHFARMWLDVARYADTKGYVLFEEAGYPWAYTYRDYVIESFNADKPYDRFVQEQIAADRLPNSDRRALRGLGFLTVGGRFMGNAHDVIDDRIDVVTRGLMGLSVSCARCHDHKFDPVSQAEYYGLYGVFASSEEPTVQPLFDDPPPTDQYRKFAAEMTIREQKLKDFVRKKRFELTNGARRRAAEYLLAAHANRDRPPQDDFMLIADGADLNPKMVVRWQGFLARTQRENDPTFAAWHRYASLPADAFAAGAASIVPPAHIAWAFRDVPKDMADVARRYALVLSHAQSLSNIHRGSAGVINVRPDPLLANLINDPDYPPNVVVGDYGDLDLLPDRPSQGEMQKLRKDVEQWRATGPGAPPRAMALIDAPRPITPRIFRRGNPHNLGPVVPRQFLTCVSTPPQPLVDGSGRLELARAIGSPSNPLTARVYVNRLWASLFGRGIVSTPGDFGVRGESPTHPELLDHLAATLIAEGWSTKKLIRWMVLSATYQQASLDRPEGSRVDPDNTLWWRAQRRRLGFEPMRDSLLAMAGNLDRSVGGASIVNFMTPVANRRTIYSHLDRLNVPGVYRTFDFPMPDATSPERTPTTVAPQALFLMNHPFVAAAASKLASRPDIAKLPESARIDRLFSIIYGRPATARERELAMTAIASPAQWARFTHALLMTNEAIFVD